MTANVVRLMVGATLVSIGTTSASAQAKVEGNEWWEPELTQVRDAGRSYEPAREDRAGYRDERGRIDTRAVRDSRDRNRYRYDYAPRVRGRRPSARRGQAYRIRWTETRWNDARFRGRALYGLAAGRLGPAQLRRLVGKKTFRRLDRHAARIGAYGPLTARVVPVRGPLVVQVRAGRVPVAELIDFDHDHRVDRVRLSSRTGRFR